MTGDDFLKAFSFLSDQLLPTRERAVTLHSLLGGDRKDTKPIKAYKAPFNLAFRTELGYFDWLELPENKTRLTEFGRAMTGARGWEVSENIVNGRVECPELWGGIVSRNTLQLTAYPWKNLADNSVVIDVGGGIGSTSMVLAKAYPNLRFVVEDRPHVVEIAPTVWGCLAQGAVGLWTGFVQGSELLRSATAEDRGAGRRGNRCPRCVPHPWLHAQLA
ncbi:hypothetical protein NUW54_g14236 [Trametes sanguinea]|uniref:Uncharacterized protein n=1 Tax=Trametes sanguinea TaxID=158606 RepID=A0ACC1MDL0_9APHY|nr:hypothetical protein NUW54_g14236 [Trametes sanguinea]